RFPRGLPVCRDLPALDPKYLRSNATQTFAQFFRQSTVEKRSRPGPRRDFQKAVRIACKHVQVPCESCSKFAIMTRLYRVRSQIPNFKRNLSIFGQRL